MCAVDDIDDPTLVDLDDEGLRDRVDGSYVGSNAAMAAWLQLIAELDRRKLWAQDGHSSLGSWLRWKYRMSRQTAKEKARVARGLKNWPGATRAFAQGLIPYSSLRHIIRLPEHDPELEDRLIRLARHCTSEDVALIVRRALALAEADPEPDEASLYEQRQMWAAKTMDGMVYGSFALAPEEGALLMAALDTYLDGRHPGADWVSDAPEFRDSGVAAATPGESSADERSLDQRRADALVEMVCAYLAGGAPDTSGADRHTLNVLTDAETLSRGLHDESRCETVEGIQLPFATLARLVCDATLVRVLTNAGRITDIGTKDRNIPPALRKKLLLRDGGCRFPGCPHRRWVDAHHITSVVDHGPTEAANLVILCGYHHRLVHERDWTITGDPEAGPIIFIRPDGRPVAEPPRLRVA